MKIALIVALVLLVVVQIALGRRGRRIRREREQTWPPDKIRANYQRVTWELAAGSALAFLISYLMAGWPPWPFVIIWPAISIGARQLRQPPLYQDRRRTHEEPG